MSDQSTDRMELAKQMFEYLCAKHGYACDWSKQYNSTVDQWTTVADFVLEHNRTERDNLQVECERLRGELKAARQYNHLLATGHDFQCNARDGFECDCGQFETSDSRRIQYLQDTLKVTAADSIANTVELSTVVKFWPGVTIGQNVVLREAIDQMLKEIDHEA